jgi:hypothetical protein
MASPDCRVSGSRIRRIGEVGRCPFVRYWSIPATAVEWDKDLIVNVEVDASPDDHFAASPHRTVQLSTIRRVGGASSCPIACCGIISSAGVKSRRAAPDDHVAARPYCRMIGSACRRVGNLGSDPTPCSWIIPPAGIQVGLGVKVPTSPHDHFATSPYSRMCLSCNGGIGGTDGCPCIQCGIV